MCRQCGGKQQGLWMLLSTQLCSVRLCGFVSFTCVAGEHGDLSVLQVNTGSVLTLLTSPNAVMLELGERLLLKHRLYVELAAL